MSRLQLLINSITWLCWVGSSWCTILTGSIVQNIAIRPGLSLSSFIISSSLFRFGFPAPFQVWSIAPTYAVHLFMVKYGRGPIKLPQPLAPCSVSGPSEHSRKNIQEKLCFWPDLRFRFLLVTSLPCFLNLYIAESVGLSREVLWSLYQLMYLSIIILKPSLKKSVEKISQLHVSGHSIVTNLWIFRQIFYLGVITGWLFNPAFNWLSPDWHLSSSLPKTFGSSPPFSLKIQQIE